MSTARSRMRHRVTIHRNEGGIDSATGSKNPENWDGIADAQPCFLITTSARERVGDEVVVVTDIKLLVPLGLDIDEKDRFTNVRDRLDNVVLDGVYNAKSVLVKPGSHKEITLQKYGPLNRD